MQQRAFGPTGHTVSSIGLGTWQLGADWGEVAEADALKVLDTAAESGVAFFGTLDTLVNEGATAAYRVSVETCEALYHQRIRPQMHHKW